MLRRTLACEAGARRRACCHLLQFRGAPWGLYLQQGTTQYYPVAKVALIGEFRSASGALTSFVPNISTTMLLPATFPCGTDPKVPVSNFSEKVAFIWSVADLLRGPYKPHQYGRVILPLTVLRRLDCVLEPTKAKVLEKHAEIKGQPEQIVDRILNRTAKKS